MNSKQLNTRIKYLYRDSSNYKMHNQCIIQGQLSDAQQRVILASCDFGTDFIPALVGMPEERFGDITKDDGPLFELDEYSFTETPDAATVDISADELVKKFQEYAGRWEEFAQTWFCNQGLA